MDKDSNYLTNCNTGTYEEIARACIQSKKNKKDVKSNYKDPDSDSPKLYEDMKNFLEQRLKECPLNGKFKISGIELFEKYRRKELLIHVNDDKDNHVYDIIAATDYIGYSTLRAYNEGKNFSQIGELLRLSRVLGGHMIWPTRIKDMKTGLWVVASEKVNGEFVEYATVNCWKGTHLKDRIDWTLFRLNEWYTEPENGDGFKYVFKKYHIFFELFADFREFIDFFCLGAFVTEDYQVKKLQDMQKVKDAIQERNTEMWEKINSK